MNHQFHHVAIFKSFEIVTQISFLSSGAVLPQQTGTCIVLRLSLDPFLISHKHLRTYSTFQPALDSLVTRIDVF